MMWTVTVDIERAPHAGWRALAATVLIMAGSLGAHTWAGGHLPDGAGLVGLSAVVFAASMVAMRGTVSARLLLVVVALAQPALHTSFTTLGHAEHAAHSGDVAAAWTWQMLAAHTAVTLLTAAVWWLCSRAATVVDRGTHPLHAVRRRAARPAFCCARHRARDPTGPPQRRATPRATCAGLPRLTLR